MKRILFFVAGIREERGGHEVPDRAHDGALDTAHGTCGEEGEQLRRKSATPPLFA